jgi:hypothetical protein
MAMMPLTIMATTMAMNIAHSSVPNLRNSTA